MLAQMIAEKLRQVRAVRRTIIAWWCSGTTLHFYAAVLATFAACSASAQIATGNAEPGAPTGASTGEDLAKLRGATSPTSATSASIGATATCHDHPAQVEDRGGGILWQCSSRLEWTRSDNGADINWHDARLWCAAKGSGWRLPTNGELSSLLLDENEPPSKCGPTSCRVSPKFELTRSWFWAFDMRNPSQAWGVDLDDGDWLAAPSEIDLYHRALCVRPR